MGIRIRVRETLDEPLNLRVSHDTLLTLKECAEDNDTSISDVVREAIDRLLTRGGYFYNRRPRTRRSADLFVWYPSPNAPLPSQWIVAALDASVHAHFEPDHEPDRLRYRVINPDAPITEAHRDVWIEASVETWEGAGLWKDGAPNPAAVPQDILEALYSYRDLVERLTRAHSAAEEEWPGRAP